MSDTGVAARKRVVSAIREDPFLELDDFTRDGFRTVRVSVSSSTAAAGLMATAEKAGYETRDGPDGQTLILEAPEEGASKKVPVGGNRLMSSPPDRTRTPAANPKKSSSRQAEPRDGKEESTDE